MFECRYFALDNDGYEDSGFDEVPVEIESEIRQYDFDEEDEGELADSESAVPEIPAAPVAAAPHDPPRKKPVARATKPAPAKPARAAKKKAPAKAPKKTPAQKAVAKRTSKKTPKGPVKRAAAKKAAKRPAAAKKKKKR